MVRAWCCKKLDVITTSGDSMDLRDSFMNLWCGLCILAMDWLSGCNDLGDHTNWHWNRCLVGQVFFRTSHENARCIMMIRLSKLSRPHWRATNRAVGILDLYTQMILRTRYEFVGYVPGFRIWIYLADLANTTYWMYDVACGSSSMWGNAIQNLLQVFPTSLFATNGWIVGISASTIRPLTCSNDSPTQIGVVGRLSSHGQRYSA